MLSQGCREASLEKKERIRSAFAPDYSRVQFSLAAPESTPVPPADPRLTAPPTQSPSPSPTAAPTPFSMLWFSDTQVYAYKYPKVFNTMAAYAVNHQQELNALCVLQTGDIVDNRHMERHWKNAAHAIGLMKEKIPFYCIAGNHDVGADKADYAVYLTYAFNDMAAPEQQYKDGVCWYETLEAGGTNFLLLGLGWQTDTEYFDWAQEVLEKYPDHVCILLVHNFLSDDGSLTSNGRRVERNLVRLYKNIRLILCGHNDGSARKDIVYENGRTAYALMYNFQDDKKKGLGYLRILTFDPVTRSVGVQTYSPYFSDYNYYEDESRDCFTLENAF